MLSSLGYETDLAPTGRQAVRLAIASPDYEVAFLDTTIDGPPIVLLLQELRNDCRTAGLRIGLMAREGRLPQADRLARGDPLCVAFSRPHTREAVQWQLRQLGALAPREFVPLAERRMEAGRALAALAAMASSSGKVYDVGRARDTLLAALYVPEFTAAASAALAHVASPEAQRALVNVASRPDRPLRRARRRPRRFARARSVSASCLRRRRFGGNTTATIAAAARPRRRSGCSPRSSTSWKPRPRRQVRQAVEGLRTLVSALSQIAGRHTQAVPLSLRERAGVRGCCNAITNRTAKSPPGSPHPNPLPEGEGTLNRQFSKVQT